MSESDTPFDVVPRAEAYHGVQEFDGSWALKLFAMTAACIPFADLRVMHSVLAPMLRAIDVRMSPEFDYGRFGFCIVHTGRRGICINVTHFGAWGTTFEVFSSGWYSYGHAFSEFEHLDDIEPALCWFEMWRSVEEVRLVCDLARALPLSEIRRQYLASIPRRVDVVRG